MESIGLIATDLDGTLIGSVDESRVFSQAHPGAVYLHQGDGYVVEELDESVGAVVEALARNGVADRTLIIISSDNGPWLIKNKDFTDGQLPADEP